MSFYLRLRKYNENHEPAGSPKGGQFASGHGAGSGASGKPQEGQHQPPGQVNPAGGKTPVTSPKSVGLAMAKDYLSKNLQTMSPDDIMNNPYMQDALDRMKEIPLTNKEPGFDSEEWWTNREFKLGDTTVKGLDKGLAALTQKAEGYAGGHLKQERKAFVVIGPPAAGKSTISEKLAAATGSSIVDPDDAKAVLPEFKGGIGANAVHEESGALADMVQADQVKKGNNIVFPKVGHDPEKIRRFTKALKSMGYEVNLVSMNVHKEEALRRMAARFVKTGRLINPTYIFNVVGDGPAKTYKEVKGDPQISSYAELDGHGPYGQPPKLTDGNGWLKQHYGGE